MKSTQTHNRPQISGCLMSKLLCGNFVDDLLTGDDLTFVADRDLTSIALSKAGFSVILIVISLTTDWFVVLFTSIIIFTI